MPSYSMKDALKDYLAHSPFLKSDLTAMQIGDVWEEVMGKVVAKYTDEIKVHRKTLYVTTHVAALKTELLYEREKIKIRLNEILGEDSIREVVIK